MKQLRKKLIKNGMELFLGLIQIRVKKIEIITFENWIIKIERNQEDIKKYGYLIRINTIDWLRKRRKANKGKPIMNGWNLNNIWAWGEKY